MLLALPSGLLITLSPQTRPEDLCTPMTAFASWLLFTPNEMSHNIYSALSYLRKLSGHVKRAGNLPGTCPDWIAAAGRARMKRGKLDLYVPGLELQLAGHVRRTENLPGTCPDWNISRQDTRKSQKSECRNLDSKKKRTLIGCASFL